MAFTRSIGHRWVALTKRWIAQVIPGGTSLFAGIGPHAGTSPEFGKSETIAFIEESFPDRNTSFLDVGPGRGIYRTLLRNRGYTRMDAVEIYDPYIQKFGLRELYDEVHACDIRTFTYQWYDVVIFGDVLEHLSVDEGRRAIDFAREHCRLIVVAVPYLRPQVGSQLDGSGDHRQPDLTREVFLARYPGFQLLLDDRDLGVFTCHTRAAPPAA